MDTKNNNLAEGLRKLIDDWRRVDKEEDKITNIVKFICQNYNEKADNGWLEQVSKHPLILRELFEKNEVGSFKCSSGIKVLKDNKTLGEKEINDILGKIEKKELNLGYEFLLNKDEKHKELLAELNGMIRKWESLKKIAARCRADAKKYNSTIERESLQKKSLQKKEELDQQTKIIARFIGDHYRTFVARLQQGVTQGLVGDLLKKNSDKKTYMYKGAHKFLKEAADRGLILIVTRSMKEYLLDPFDRDNKTFKLIKHENSPECPFRTITVDAHALGNLDSVLSYDLNCAPDSDSLVLIPFNEKCLSFISARQTEGVESTCSVVNKFIGVGDKGKSKKTKVILKGASQGVDFITKMVGSTHGRDQTRIKNADIELEINAPHIFQDEQKIVKRLINGAKNNNNTITCISVKNDMGKRLHPKCKTDKLFRLLEYYWRDINNEVEIKDLQRTSSQQQNAFY